MNNLQISKIFRKCYYGLIKRNFRYISSPFRLLPNFIIIGAVRSGTTSLYYDICEHSCVLPADYDEIGFFDSNYELGINWYKSMFPTKIESKKIELKTGICITGEDTPFYFWDTDASKRIKNEIPKIKLIILLRNPIDRAYSNYNLGKRSGNESLSFEDAIKKEIELLKKNNDFESDKIEKFRRNRSYIAKGLYHNQIRKWLALFSKDQILILNTEDLEENPHQALKKVFGFLGLPNEEIKNIQHRKVANYEKMNVETRQFLSNLFKPYNEKLFRLLEKEFDWD
ncbi:sulfotransferase domain-containing protein [Nitrosopumilus sp.]|uniref:sulfotransferase domain-containing protein n=1 Tax=Nitrosopumilus sp. TaxID=2024843 RepID=UPI003D0B8C4A